MRNIISIAAGIFALNSVALLYGATVHAGEWRYSVAPKAMTEPQVKQMSEPEPSAKAKTDTTTMAKKADTGTVSDSMDIPTNMSDIERPIPFHDMPTNNMIYDIVTARYGEPDSRAEPVGDPPINRWYYPIYTVYFERDRVLTSVVNSR